MAESSSESILGGTVCAERTGLPAAVIERMRELRRAIHRRPELSGAERATAALAARELRGLGLEVREPVADTGVVGILRGGRPGKVVLWRADTDGLPIQEETGLEYASEVAGVMHACGHDCHTAVGLALARLLAAERADLPGTVVFAFQPAEEGEGGAARMIAEGVLDEPRVDYVLAYHVSLDLDTGRVEVTGGPAGAGCLDFTVEVRGAPGHGAHPDEGCDAIPPAAQIVLALHGLRARAVPQTEPLVLSVGTFHGGTRANVLAERVVLEGTIRAFDAGLIEDLGRRARRAALETASAWGARAEFTAGVRYPPLVNDRAVAARVQAAAERAGCAVAPAVSPGMGAEDMAFFLQAVPGCFFKVGARQATRGCLGPHHSPRFCPDEDHLPIALAVACRAVRDLLSR